ncbi:MAG: tRNA epoxyqueuosine(34) reductase QueG [Planctomycetota bacterium]
MKQIARAVGFDLAGITPAQPLKRAAYYREWLAAGHAGQMHFLARRVAERTDPTRLLPGARSVICAALRYGREDAYLGPALMRESDVRAGCVALPLREDRERDRPRGLVAQYARGRDYHLVLRTMLEEVLARLRSELSEPFAARICVDTAPLLEREVAAAAGLGWIGKNTCLLNGRLGSYLFLGEIVTDLALAGDEPRTDGCANCRRCLDACPTGALVGPHQMDARRCISYLTIEHRGELPGEVAEGLGARVYGCDVCQQVCPYNAHASRVGHPEIAADLLPARPDLEELARLTSGGWRRLVRGTAGRRASRAMWRRNAEQALRNLAATGAQGRAGTTRAGNVP